MSVKSVQIQFRLIQNGPTLRHSLQTPNNSMKSVKRLTPNCDWVIICQYSSNRNDYCELCLYNKLIVLKNHADLTNLALIKSVDSRFAQKCTYLIRRAKQIDRTLVNSKCLFFNMFEKYLGQSSSVYHNLCEEGLLYCM